MKIKYCLLLVVLLGINFCNAQDKNDLDVKLGKYRFRTTYNDSDYSSKLKVTEGNDIIFKDTYIGTVADVVDVDFNNDGFKTYLLLTNSGGAHCCNTLIAYKISNDKMSATDTLFLADSYYELSDMDKNGKKEFTAYNMMFAYAFTNFAETHSPIVIYTLQNGKFKEITKNYPILVNQEIDEWKNDLQVFLDSNYQCQPEGTETFNTDAGSVKTILAGITADYFTLGEVYKGYDLIEKTYPCLDKDAFIKILKEDYKLK